LVFIEISLIATIGYVDYQTGDYSILIFYAIPVALASWSHGGLGAIIVSVAAGCARYISEYGSYSNSDVRYLNSIIDMLFLLILGLAMSAIIRLIEEENGKRGITATDKINRRAPGLAKVGIQGRS